MILVRIVTSCCLGAFVTDINVTINPLKSKFSRNLVFYVSRKFSLSSFVGIFVRILYIDNSIVMTPFKTGITFFAALHYFLELVNPIFN